MADPRTGAGVYGSAGTRDTRVDRPDEGLPGVATVENPTANPPSRSTLETNKATGLTNIKFTGNIDTTGTQGGPPDAQVKARMTGPIGA